MVNELDTNFSVCFENFTGVCTMDVLCMRGKAAVENAFGLENPCLANGQALHETIKRRFTIKTIL